MRCKWFVFVLLMAAFICNAEASENQNSSRNVSVQLIRNATVKVYYGETTFLIDPMLADQGAYSGFENTYRSELRNPLTPLPISMQAILKDVDAVILTHTHLDHWDDAARDALPKNIPLFVQNKEDADLLRSQGFKDVRILEEQASFGGVTLLKTACQHGSDAMYADQRMAKFIGSVMGIVFKAPNMKTVYVAADTIWYDEVEKTIRKNNPDVIVLNTGAAAFSLEAFKADPFIIMGKEDTERAAQAAPNASIVAVHMDAINHMTIDRKSVSEYARQKGIRNRVLIPFDGEKIPF